MLVYLVISYGYVAIAFALWSLGYRFNVGAAFIIGLAIATAPMLLIKIAAPIAGTIMGFSQMRRLHQNSALLGPLGELKDVERQADQARVRSALDKLDLFADGTPRWLHPGVDQWLEAPAGDEKDRMRDALLQRLYDEAGKPGDIMQRHALNDVRLAINPWVDER